MAVRHSACTPVPASSPVPSIPADRPVTVPGEHSRESLPYQLPVDHGVAESYERHGPPVAVHSRRLHLHHLGKYEDRGEVPGLGPEVLILLGAVDAPESYLI